MQGRAKVAFVLAAISALLCIAAYILFTYHLHTHRPRVPEGLNCWPIKALDQVFATRGESVLSAVLRNGAYIATFIAVALDRSLRRRR